MDKRTAQQSNPSKETIRAARSLALNIALMGGPNLTHLSDHELVERMTLLCGAFSVAARDSGVSASSARDAFALLGQALRCPPMAES